MIKLNLVLINFFTVKPVCIAALSLMLLISCNTKKEKHVEPIIINDSTMEFYDASNPNIQYTGRIDYTDPKAPQFWCPGSSIKAKFEGPSISISLQDYSVGGAQSTNYYNIFIDNEFHSTLASDINQTIYNISDNLADTYHTIEIFKRTEAMVGHAAFYGFYIGKGKHLLPLENKPSRKIEFIGDSYTCGYGDEVSIPDFKESLTGFNSINENNYIAWGAITARNLNAEYHCTAYSGKGMYRNNGGDTEGTLPKIYMRINPDDEKSKWKTNAFIPDVVVIHLGTNDFFPEKLSSEYMVDSTVFVNTYITFTEKLRGYYPSAKIICVVPNSQSDSYPENLRSQTRITNYIQAVTDSRSKVDNNIFFFALPEQSSPYGEDQHPSKETQIIMAANIQAFIKSKTDW